MSMNMSAASVTFLNVMPTCGFYQNVVEFVALEHEAL